MGTNTIFRKTVTRAGGSGEMNLHENKNYSEDSFSSFSTINDGVPSPTIPTHLRTSPSLISNNSTITRGIVALIDPPHFPTFDVLIIFIPQMLVFCVYKKYYVCIINYYFYLW
ncbi:MAG: hypothetical protein QM396_07095 [Euryarchaeota archaeon]|uniref:hypothetical protein n=1 Tax=Methanobacterium sp. MZD130B TaxID=3394378 RepID=UPI0037666557|nr:hypothetical protein [Methanobacterium sp.]MDI9435757.1 hypothetical protein [Euryarchaeota archaeon]